MALYGSQHSNRFRIGYTEFTLFTAYPEFEFFNASPSSCKYIVE